MAKVRRFHEAMADCNAIAQQFVQYYYQQFDAKNFATLQTFYNDQSILTYEGDRHQGAANIIQKLQSLNVQSVQHQVEKIDTQPVEENPGGFLIFVAGKLAFDGAPPMAFAQVFHLIMFPRGNPVCLNDCFRLNIG